MNTGDSFSSAAGPFRSVSQENPFPPQTTVDLRTSIDPENMCFIVIIFVIIDQLLRV